MGIRPALGQAGGGRLRRGQRRHADRADLDERGPVRPRTPLRRRRSHEPRPGLVVAGSERRDDPLRLDPAADGQAGWRTVVHRQTDAYFLMAGGGEVRTASGDPRFALVVGAAAGCASPVAGGTGWLDASASWCPPIALFLAGSAIDVWLTGPGTVIGPTLVAAWYALTARRRAVAMTMFAVAVALAVVTVLALAGQSVNELAGDGVVRSAALGLLLIAGGVLAATCRPSQAE